MRCVVFVTQMKFLPYTVPNTNMSFGFIREIFWRFLEYKMAWESQYRADMSKNLSRLRLEESFTDVAIQVEDKVFHCHKVVLASMSSFFKTMFSTDMKEKMTGEIMLKEMSAEVFDTLLTFIYTGDNVVDKDNVDQLLDASSMLDIPSLRMCCETFLSNSIDPSTCIRIWQTTYLHECSVQIVERAWSLILKHFESIWEGADFDILQKDKLFSVLKDPNLNVSNVDIISQASLKWLQADLDNRADYITDLLNLLAGIPGCINSLKTITIHCDFPELREEVLQYARHLESANPTTNTLDGACGSVANDETFILVGGNDSGSNQMLTCFSHRAKKWFVLCPPPVDPGFNFAVCHVKSKLFLSGGTSSPVKFMQYDGETNTWSILPELPTERKRICHSMASVGDNIFVLGGMASFNKRQPIGEVDKFVLGRGQWEKSGSMAKPVRSMACCSLGTTIFLIGGFDQNSKETDLIQYFDTRDSTSGYYQYKMPVPSIKSRTVCLDGCLYIVCPSGKVVAFRPKAKPEIVGSVENFPRSGFGLSLVGNRLLVVGGEVMLKCSKDMLMFDTVKRKTFLMEETLPISLQDFGSTSLTIPRYHLTREMKTELMPV
ncbi:hypothetical protein ScPMuIL_015213 [Solemya velum]